MSPAATVESVPRYWSEESSNRPDRARIRARIGGLHCSLCTGTIEKALGKRPGVDKVAVSLTHEQALIEYDPNIVRPEDLLQTLKDIGYTISDPRKLRPFDEEEAALVHEGRRFIEAIGFSLAAIALVANPVGFWSTLLALIVFGSLVALFFVVLTPRGLGTAITGTIGLCLLGAALYTARSHGWLASAGPWITGAFALIMAFALANHILIMAIQALKRGILNQHVLLEIGAFAGIAGGLIGLALQPVDYPTASFFAVSVMVVTYHVFSEWLSLIVKTRSSQAVKKLLDLQPQTARVVRGEREKEIPIEQVKVVRIRPGERIPVDAEVISGHSAVDESLVSGEPIPVEKVQGSKVVGGSTNRVGTLLVRVTAIGEECFLQQVIRHVEDARALKPGLLHLVDRVLRIYTPTVLAIAVLGVVGWVIGSWLLTGQVDIERAVFAVASNGNALGIIALGDRLRADAADTVAALRNAGITPILRTGDNERAANRVAREAGINEVYADVLPERKAEIIRGLQQRGKVAMVGDGINDAPALMQADVGIAMGSGTDIAIESADIIMLGNRLESILVARDISRRGYRKMVQNVVLAFCFNGIGIPVAATGRIYPVWAMAAMAGSVTAIFFNSLWGRASLFFDAIISVGRQLPSTPARGRPILP